MSRVASSTGVPGKEDILGIYTPEPTNILVARLDNWKHAVSILQDFLDTQLSTQKSVTSGLEKARKSIADAPKFDFASGASRTTSPPTSPVEGQQPPLEDVSQTGIAESFENLRSKTEVLYNKSLEVEKSLKSSVGPQLETLKGDIEKHMKGLKSSSVKGLKEVEKAKAATQKQVENLGHYASSASGGHKVDAKNDPYVLHRSTLSTVEDLLTKENTQLDAVQSSQKNFQTLERHIVQVIQQTMGVLKDVQHDWSSLHMEAFDSISASFNNIQEDHEWELFTEKQGANLVPGSQTKRDISGITFANDGHESTVPLMEGILQRKGKISRSYDSSYFVLTQARWLHAFKSRDHVQDPNPEWSMYIPEASLGPASTPDSGKAKFQISGKTASKTTLGSHSYTFKAATFDEMSQWYDALRQATGITTTTTGGSLSSPPTSPTSEGAAPIPGTIGEAPPATIGAPADVKAAVPVEPAPPTTGAPPSYPPTGGAPLNAAQEPVPPAVAAVNATEAEVNQTTEGVTNVHIG
ncbi:hypothetical protein TRVA0_031S01618 [Trichomonascus vanleenenianus]|uniref:uncharacterized protein n=1 Tax=Trichomonascus vanleenenianus TaxID=2268995 RepID=UPI003ECB44FF